MTSQMSPNTAGPFTPQVQQTPASANGNYAGFGGYNMLGMGLPAMGVLNGFPYNAAQLGNFNQVRTASFDVDFQYHSQQHVFFFATCSV